MKNIARIVATAALATAAVLTAGAAAHADGGAIDWPVAPTSAERTGRPRHHPHRLAVTARRESAREFSCPAHRTSGPRGKGSESLSRIPGTRAKKGALGHGAAGGRRLESRYRKEMEHIHPG